LKKLKVTVITPVLNGYKTIIDCIESVQKQDYGNVEHIIIDGGSTDGTIELLKEKNLKFVSEQDCGIYDAFNKGVALATGQVINILNSDDYYTNNKVISRVIDIFEREGCDLVHGLAEQIDEFDRMIWVIGADVTKEILLNKMKVAHPTVFVSRSVYQNHGNFSVGFMLAADHEFLLRVWDKIKSKFIHETLVNMRNGGASTSQVKLSYRESLSAVILHGQSLPVAFARYYWELFKQYCIILPLRKLGYQKT
jgi:glycosyltransferase